MALTLIDEATAAGARVHQACAVLGLNTRTHRRWKAAQQLHDARRGAAKTCAHALSQEERQAIVDICNTPEHQSLAPSQIVPRLAERGIYLASESSFYRVLKAHQQQQRRGRAKAPCKRTRPQAFVAQGPNQVWSWDITYLPSSIKGQFWRLYMVVDIYSRAIVGWEVHAEELSSHAATLISRACLRHQVRRNQLVLHADNGSPMKGATMLATLQHLGVLPSFSRPSVSDDNPYSEALFRTLKYSPAYPDRPFATLDGARQWVQRFVRWYNEEHRHSAIKFVTPMQRHSGLDGPLLAKRHATYTQAKAAHPERWNGRAVRNWQPVREVWLNPERNTEELMKKLPAAA